jgi:ATP:ADP antiporter, AAA family
MKQGLMFFCILFNYTILRDTKDVLMITAHKSGAEVIPFIKTYCNLPAAIVSVVIYRTVASARKTPVLCQDVLTQKLNNTSSC